VSLGQGKKMLLFNYFSVSSRIGSARSGGMVLKVGWCDIGMMRTCPPPGTASASGGIIWPLGKVT